MNSNWTETEERVITLEDVECATCELASRDCRCIYTHDWIVDIILEWLYSQCYPKNHRFASPTIDTLLARAKACALGDHFLASSFRKASENALVDRLLYREQPPHYAAVTYAYKNLPSESPAFQAIVDAQCAWYHEGADDNCGGELERRSQLPNDFLIGVMLRYMRLQTGKVTKNGLDRCDYHEHTSDDERTRSARFQPSTSTTTARSEESGGYSCKDGGEACPSVVVRRSDDGQRRSARCGHRIQCYASKQILNQCYLTYRMWRQCNSLVLLCSHSYSNPMHVQLNRRFQHGIDQSTPSSARRKSSSSTSIRLMRFLVNSNAVKKMALTTQDRDIETPRPGRN